MSKPLDEILESIAPERIVGRVSMPIDRAINSFDGPPGPLEERGAFVSYVGRFWVHVFGSLLGGGEPPSPDPFFCSAHAVRLLKAAFGENGVDTAHRMARQGIEGGLGRVLRAVAEQMAIESERIFIQTMIGEVWNRLDFEEQGEAVRDYFSIYGHLLRPEFLRGNPERFVGEFPEILGQHPALVARLHRIV